MRESSVERGVVYGASERSAGARVFRFSFDFERPDCFQSNVSDSRPRVFPSGRLVRFRAGAQAPAYAWRVAGNRGIATAARRAFR